MKRLLVLVSCLGIVAATTSFPQLSAQASSSSTSYSKTKTIQRDHLVDGANDVVDKRTVTVHVSQTKELRDRQEITVSWKGAHPTGGLVTDDNSAAAALQEYPVVVMQCRGVDSASVPASRQVRPQTCWTLTPAERFAYSLTGFSYPSYRMDRYATTADRAYTVDQPKDAEAKCGNIPSVAHWVPFVAANKQVYPGGILGCAGMAPEAANAADSLQPGNTTYGVADTHGNGSIKFVIQTDETNASLGCSARVACTLEVIPIEGISCDAAGTATGNNLGMPLADRPDPSLVPTIQQQCAQTGVFGPGDYNTGGEQPDYPVTGDYWWTASNWRNRFSVPLTFAQSANVCSILRANNQTAYIYGSEALLQATQQWDPHFCLDKTLFTLQHVQTSETQAKNLLNIGNIEAAVQASPPTTPFAKPVVQAPTAFSGFAIAYSIDGANGHTYRNLKLDPRLLAKLLTESYRSCADCLDFTSKDAKKSGFDKLANNPIDITRDPEFQQLNPGVPETFLYEQPAATLAVMSSDSDVMTALTSYINSDPEARAWLNGKPDPWGMRVNPAYKGISLPVTNWPLLDQHIAKLATGANRCLEEDPVPWLPLVAAPVSNPATVSLNMQFDIANSQVNCQNNGSQNQKLAGIGRETPGERVLFGLVPLADARRYELNVASLQTHSTWPADKPLAGSTGRTFVAPTDAALRAAAQQMEPSKRLQDWSIPYESLRTTTAGKAAYPGAFLISIDVPTKGLHKQDAKNYATLLRFVAGAGQEAGLDNGQLPPGYLPMTGANGLGAERAYTLKAADAVAAQNGAIWPLPPPVPTRSPSVSSPPPTSSSSSPPVAGGGHSTTPTGSGPVGGATGDAATPTGSASSTKSPSPTTSPTPSSSSTPSPTPSSSSAPGPAAETVPVNSGPLGLALPILAVVALAALGLAGWMSGVGRR